MLKNVGRTDRLLRAVLGALLLLVAMFGAVGGWLVYALGLVGGVLLVTAAVSFCPLYRVIGLSTCRI